LTNTPVFTPTQTYTVTETQTPQPVPTATATATFAPEGQSFNAVKAAGLWGHSLLLDSGDMVWGAGDNTESGLGLIYDCHVPPTACLVKQFTYLLDNVDSVAVSCGFSFVVKNDGSLWGTGEMCWGVEGCPFGSGQYFTAYKNFTYIMDGAVKVALGAWHSFVIKTNGELWVSGHNNGGQLGLGHNDSVYAFQQVPDMTGVVDIATGPYHSHALKADKTLWATGSLFGDGSGNTTSSFVQIMTNVKAVFANGTCWKGMLIRDDDVLMAFGDNSNGYLGGGSAIHLDSFTEVLNDVSFASVGRYHSLAIKNDGSLWAAGVNYWGQFGIGDNVDRDTFIKVMEGVRYAIAGSHYSIAIKNDGTVWAAGSNESRMLGLGDMESTNVWVEVRNYGM